MEIQNRLFSYYFYFSVHHILFLELINDKLISGDINSVFTECLDMLEAVLNVPAALC